MAAMCATISGTRLNAQLDLINGSHDVHSVLSIPFQQIDNKYA